MNSEKIKDIALNCAVTIVILSPLGLVYAFVYVLSGWEGVKVFTWVTGLILGCCGLAGWVGSIGGGGNRRSSNNDFATGYVIGNFLGKK